MIKLSIIVPVYNMASDNKLTYCLESLIAQTIDSYEIIAVDDCSTDNSLEILKEYEMKYPERIKVVASKRNKKQGGAKNLGLLEAKGEWIGFVDSDDWIAKDMYKRLLERAEDTGADMVGCDYHLTNHHSMEIGQIVHNNKEEQTGVLTKEKYKSLLLDGGSLVVKIYKREIIYGIPSRFPEDMFYEDNALCKSWMMRATHFEYVKEPLYYYYQHDASTVHTITKERCEDRMQAARIMIAEAKKYGYYEEYKEELEITFVILFYVNTLFSYMVGVKKQKYQFLKKMSSEMKATFPEFRKNKYYKERVHEEERKLIGFHMKSTIFFWCYYKLLWFYRKLRAK